ncbi:putative transposase [Botryosphaeria dothidea]|uniref:Transposase n=1 Tax=Botryosphaeria dothidea TaxID=55169 RepID=A0A8H4N4B8_9PEZI|nr:putative transposase [Botryosphaeria dothidea]
MHNFDETSFIMGTVSTGLVVTSSERRTRPKQLQQGDREWVTVIQGINAIGWAIPPFVIFKAQNHLANWYSNETLHDWAIRVSDNGWTTNELSLEWLKHFDKHIKDRTKGAYRLLIIDGYESHRSAKFDEFCEQKKIITLYMPAHLSHLLQPLDVGCFSPLKNAYGKQIESLMRAMHTHIAKEDFLPAFRIAFAAAFIRANIQGGFRRVGVAPYNPEAVISKLNVRLRTPTPPMAEDAT